MEVLDHQYKTYNMPHLTSLHNMLQVEGCHLRAIVESATIIMIATRKAISQWWK
jgi:hypothetical protein